MASYESKLFGKWRMRHELMNMGWSHGWLTLHEQKEFDSGLTLISVQD
jgi:hypothetical protein